MWKILLFRFVHDSMRMYFDLSRVRGIMGKQ